MITKEQQEALKNLTKYVSDYCEKNSISVLMVSAISEECADGLEQICSSAIQGNGKHIVCSIAGCIKAQDKLGMFLTEGFRRACRTEAEINNIPMDNSNLN